MAPTITISCCRRVADRYMWTSARRALSGWTAEKRVWRGAADADSADLPAASAEFDDLRQRALAG